MRRFPAVVQMTAMMILIVSPAIPESGTMVPVVRLDVVVMKDIGIAIGIGRVPA